MKREERRRADALDRFWDATQRGEAPMRPSEVDEVAATVVDHLDRNPASPDIHAAQFRVRQRIVAAVNTTEETMHTSALPNPNAGRTSRPSMVPAMPTIGHRRETFTRLGLAAMLLLTLAAGYFRFGPPRTNDDGLPVIPAAIQATDVATPADATPYPSIDHVIIGAWEVDNTLCNGPAATPSRMIFDPDGSFVMYDDFSGVSIGMWRATGERTVEVVAIAQHYMSIESMFGVSENLPLPESFQAPWLGVIATSQTMEVDETGSSLIFRGFYEPRDVDGNVLVHFEFADNCGFEVPAYRMATVEKPAP